MPTSTISSPMGKRMSTILVLGSADDLCIRAVLGEVDGRGESAILVSEQDLRTTLGMNLELAGTTSDGFLSVGGRRLPFAELGGVLVRLSPMFGWGAAADDEELLYVQAELLAALHGLFRALPCPVINRLRPGSIMGPVFARSGLANAVRKSGFAQAPALVADTSEATLAFYDAHAGKVLSGPPRFDRPVLLAGDEGRTLLAAQGSRPCYLQAVPPGPWLRSPRGRRPGVRGRDRARSICTRRGNGPWSYSKSSDGLCRAMPAARRRTGSRVFRGSHCTGR